MLFILHSQPAVNSVLQEQVITLRKSGIVHGFRLSRKTHLAKINNDLILMKCLLEIKGPLMTLSGLPEVTRLLKIPVICCVVGLVGSVCVCVLKSGPDGVVGERSEVLPHLDPGTV